MNAHATKPKNKTNGELTTRILECQQAGINLLPIGSYEDKRPLVKKWSHLQTESMTAEDYAFLQESGAEGIAMICGPVSGGLLAIDFDNLQAYDDFAYLMQASDDDGIVSLWGRVSGGYEEKSGKGLHILVYLDPAAGEFPRNEKWAFGEANPEKSEPPPATIETRASGGYIIVAPSFKSKYKQTAGGIASIARITLAEYQALKNTALAVCKHGGNPPVRTAGENILTVGSDTNESLISKFNQSVTWEGIIKPDEFVKVHTQNNRTYWRRSGKPRGISAVSGAGGKATSDSFCCFSSNGPSFLPLCRTVSKFDYVMYRDYAGDFNRAFDELTKPFRQEKREKARGKKEQETGKPNLVISDNEDAMLRNAFKILEADTLLYRKDGRLVTPTIDKKNDRRKSKNDIFFALTACDSSFVRQRLAELSTPCKEVFNTKTKDFVMQPCRIPDLIPKAILATAMNGELNPLPRIDGILHGPVINENGALVNSQGLVEISGLNFYQAGDIPDFNLPETITREDAEEAGRQLLNLLVDYEFESKEYDPAKWLAMILTQLCRPLVEYSPFFILTANTSRAGKTLLVDAMGLICHGNHPQRLAWPTRSDRREDELAKTVSGYAFEGKTLCFWDNLQDGSSLISEKLCQDLTAAYIHNRMLHSNTMIGGRNLLQFIASGNNISPSGDLIGRSIVVKVFSSNAAPGNRDPKKFIHGRLDSHIKKNRLPILRNALMILAGYIRAGRPDMPGAHLAGFDDWVSLVCGSIRWAVGIDPIEDQQKTAMEADPQTQGLIALALNWGQVFGDIPQKAGAIYRKLAGAMDAEDNTPALALLEALETLYGGACIKNQNQIPLILKRFLGKRIRCNDRVYILDGKLDSKNGGLIYSMRTE